MNHASSRSSPLSGFVWNRACLAVRDWPGRRYPSRRPERRLRNSNRRIRASIRVRRPGPEIDETVVLSASVTSTAVCRTDARKRFGASQTPGLNTPPFISERTTHLSSRLPRESSLCLTPAIAAPALSCYGTVDLVITRAIGGTLWDAPALAAVAELVDALA